MTPPSKMERQTDRKTDAPFDATKINNIWAFGALRIHTTF
jgi:hypothetical protein